MEAVERDEWKRTAARAAVEYVDDGMVVGLGTGSTAAYVIMSLGARVRKGLRVRGVPTSRGTAQLARREGIPLVDGEERWTIDVAIDGADQVDPHLNLIKGGGGALLKEKIVATAAKRFIVVVDESKRVELLGQSVPLPIEVVPFGWGNTAGHIEALGFKPVLRMRHGKRVHTEEGHYILDVDVPGIERPRDLERCLHDIPGVVETGLFVGRTSLLIVGTPRGIDTQHAGS